MLDPNAISDANHAAMLGRVEASIMGESALIDETGRVYWEGGSSSTLYEVSYRNSINLEQTMPRLRY